MSRMPGQLARTVLRGDRRSNAAVLPDTGLAAARSFLFVPGDRPGRFVRAEESGADVVVFDLEAPERGMLAFTVPGMHEFVLRQDGQEIN